MIGSHCKRGLARTPDPSDCDRGIQALRLYVRRLDSANRLAPTAADYGGGGLFPRFAACLAAT